MAPSGRHDRLDLLLENGYQLHTEGEMIVCLCEGLNDRQLRAAIDCGGHRTVSALVRETRAGSHCGQCACDLKRLLRERQPIDVVEPAPVEIPLAAK